MQRCFTDGANRKVAVLAVLALAAAAGACGPSTESPVAPQQDFNTAGVVAGEASFRSLNFAAHLSGGPAATDSKGQGQATVKFNADETELSFRLNVANIENVTMAHIHVAQTPGGNGPPVVWLYPDGPPAQLIAGRSDGTLAAGTRTAADLVGPLQGQSLADLVVAIREGRAYVNVHTTQHPPGEIRGTLR